MESLEKIGFKIKKLRELRDYCQQYMATELDISQRSYSRIENGEADLTMSRLTKVARILDISPQLILSFDDSLYFISNSARLGVNNSNLTEAEKQLYVNQIELLKSEIHFLRGQLDKANK